MKGASNVTTNRTLVIVPCTDRKRTNGHEPLLARDLPESTTETVATTWNCWIDAAEGRVKASDLYCGRAFKEAQESALRLNADLFVVSAGLGVVSVEDAVSPYSLTISSGKPDTIGRRIKDEACSPTDWWHHLHAGSSRSKHLSELLTSGAYDLVLMALSGAYAEMISEDLHVIDAEAGRRLRIFGLALGAVLPANVQACQMPYDHRLNGPDSSIRGTLTDFASRAIAHFAEGLGTGTIAGTSLSEDTASVTSALRTWRFPDVPKRERLTDAGVIDFIRREWNVVGGRSGEMLRHLRASGLACEQSRFRDLFHQASAIRSTPSEVA